MKLGPIQEQWLKNLEEHPERQTGGRLGCRFNTNDYQACCLGEYLITYKKYHGFSDDDIWSGEQLWDGDSHGDVSLEEHWSILGLYTSEGCFQKGGYYHKIDAVNGHSYMSLAEMNDSGITWPEIARHIRENPDLVFRESL